MEENKENPVEKAENKGVIEEKKETAKVTEKKDKKVEEKTKTTKVETEKKSQNNILIIGIIAVVIAMVTILIAMTMGNQSPKKVVEKSLQELKRGAYTQQMLSGFMQGEDQLNAEAEKLLFEKLEWKILNEKEEGETATVEIEIKNKDFKEIMTNYIQKAWKVAFSGASEEELKNYLMDELRNEEIQTVTKNGTIQLQKKDGKWEIANQEEFTSIVLPGLYEAMNNSK